MTARSPNLTVKVSELAGSSVTWRSQFIRRISRLNMQMYAQLFYLSLQTHSTSLQAYINLSAIPFRRHFQVGSGSPASCIVLFSGVLANSPSPLPFPLPLPPPPIPWQSLLPRPILHSHKTDFCLQSSWQQQRSSTEQWLRNKPTFPLAVRSF